MVAPFAVENISLVLQMMQRLLEDHADMINNNERPFFTAWGYRPERMAYLDHYLEVGGCQRSFRSTKTHIRRGGTKEWLVTLSPQKLTASTWCDGMPKLDKGHVIYQPR